MYLSPSLVWSSIIALLREQLSILEQEKRITLDFVQIVSAWKKYRQPNFSHLPTYSLCRSTHALHVRLNIVFPCVLEFVLQENVLYQKLDALLNAIFSRNNMNSILFFLNRDTGVL